MSEQTAVRAAPVLEDGSRPIPPAIPRSPALGRGARKTLLVLIDAATLSRQCVVQALRPGARDFEIVGLTSHHDIGVSPPPDVVLFNIQGVPVTDPWVAEALQGIRARSSAPVILISNVVDGRSTLQALALGVRGVVPVTLDIGMLIAAVRLVVAGGTFLPNEILTSCLAPSADPGNPGGDVLFLGFTPREGEVLEKLKEGKINKIIAYELSISESTVKIHVRHIMRKLNATNRTQVVHLLQSREHRKGEA